jgi:hypothetical protein
MRTFRAVLLGFLATSSLILAGGWGYNLLAGSAMHGEYRATTLVAAFLTILYTGASVVAGAYVATRIHDTPQTMSGFSVAQVFFGFGLIREFWNKGSSWYGIAAVLLVIPCAITGRALARRLGRNKFVQAA